MYEMRNHLHSVLLKSKNFKLPYYENTVLSELKQCKN